MIAVGVFVSIAAGVALLTFLPINRDEFQKKF